MKTQPTSFDTIRSLARSNRTGFKAADCIEAGVPAKSVRAMLHQLLVRGELAQVNRGTFRHAAQ